jgi:hypothetical protein
MWLVPRDTRGHTRRTYVPPPVRAALVRWYMGEGSEADHRASVTVVVKAREAERWIACDCLGEEADPPLLSPAYLSEAETYYLRRLTAEGRPEHRHDCPFHRDQAPPRLRERAAAASARSLVEPDGFFEVLRLAPEKLAQDPGKADPDDRSRGSAVPRLAGLLWRLMTQAGVNTIPALERSEGDRRTMAGEFARLRAAAERIEIAPGIALARHLYTHVEPFERGQVFARLRRAAPDWPDGHAPQAFLLLYATGVSGHTLTLAERRTLTLRNRVQHAGVNARSIGPPFLALVAVGEHNPRAGYDALRGYAQPVQSAGAFVAVDSAPERMLADAIARLRYRLRRHAIDLSGRRMLFNAMTRDGLARADFVLSLADRRTGELFDLPVVVTGSSDGAHRDAKRRQAEQLARLGEVLRLDRDTIEQGGLAQAIADRLAIDLG